jgi:hypothetical protein
MGMDPTIRLERAALARNDRYLREFVEEFDLCPFARRCREEGKLVRRVILDDYVLPALLRAAAEIDTLPQRQCEVALLIAPGFSDGPAAFHEICSQVRRHLRRFHCVAFHPELKTDFGSENRAVQFFRRAPDPMLQLVRIATLDRVRAGRSGGSVYVNPASLAAVPDVPLSLSEEIARANLRIVRERGPEEMERLLRDVRGTGRD